MIRRATPDDAQAISRIADGVQAIHADARPDVFRPPALRAVPPADIIALLDAPDHHVWVALIGDDVVGYLMAEVQKRPENAIKRAMSRLYVHQMGVLSAFRGCGIGTALLQTAREFAADAGLKELALDVWRFNESARTFYQAQGFSVMREELWVSVHGERGDRADPPAGAFQ